MTAFQITGFYTQDSARVPVDVTTEPIGPSAEALNANQQLMLMLVSDILKLVDIVTIPDLQKLQPYEFNATPVEDKGTALPTEV